MSEIFFVSSKENFWNPILFLLVTHPEPFSGGVCMDNRYGGFNKGLNGDMMAASYFDSLPLAAKEEINRRAAEIHSLSDLRELGSYLDDKLESNASQ